MKALEKNLEILSTLFGCFGQAEDTNRLAIYTKLLKDVPPSLLNAAAQKLMLEKTFLPSVAEIVEAVRSVKATKNGEQADDYAEAWQEVLREMKRCGIYGSPKFSSTEVQRAVQLVGWRNLCCADEASFSVLHAQFREVYKQIKKRKESDAVNCYVLGIASSGEELLPVGKVKLIRER